MNYNKGIVYLIQPVELVKCRRFKIGCSRTPDLSRCKNGYNNGSRYICIMECYEPVSVETELIKCFKQKFKLVGGNEYFEGDELQLRDEFYNVVKKCSELYKNKIFVKKTNIPILINQNNNQMQNNNVTPLIQSEIKPVCNTEQLNNKSYSCKLCDKHYKSYMGYWIHNKKNHNKIIIEEPVIETKETINDVNKKTYECRKCNKILSCKQSRWKHEKTCKFIIINQYNITLEKKVNQLTNKINALEKNPQKIISNTMNYNYNILNSPEVSRIGELTLIQEEEQPKGFDDLIAELPDDEKPNWLKAKPSSKVKSKLIDISDSEDSTLSSDSESDSDEINQFLEIIIGGKAYILEDNKVYVKTDSNTKGKLYGTYINGKIKKTQQSKDINL